MFHELGRIWIFPKQVRNKSKGWRKRAREKGITRSPLGVTGVEEKLRKTKGINHEQRIQTAAKQEMRKKRGRFRTEFQMGSQKLEEEQEGRRGMEEWRQLGRFRDVLSSKRLESRQILGRDRRKQQR